MIERVVVVSPRGFCAGVVRAIATVERALTTSDAPVYVRRAIVHNSHVVDRLAAAGATFVEELDEIPDQAVVVFSAHGVPALVREEALARRLMVVDATCPLVAKVHREVRRYRDRGFDVLLIGHRGHDEVIATLGQRPGVQLVEDVAAASTVRVADPGRVACVTQTTLSPTDVEPILAELRRRFPSLSEPGAADICFATRHRQTAVTELAETVDLVLVVGDSASSNSRRLQEAASAAGTTAYLVSSVAALDDAWLRNVQVVGVSSGASTPEDIVQELVQHLCRDGAVVEQDVVLSEQVVFRLPREIELERPALVAGCGR
jgi:4-hydroxy-3-methylbut-2-enyl diphosphate reductase